MKTWFTITAKANNAAEIFIFDEIGFFGIGAGDVAKELKALGDVNSITVRINSPGGSAFDGLAIYNMLRQHPAEILVRVEGLAASAASVVAMAGDRITMPSNAFLMLHNPLGMTMGNADDHAEMAEVLTKVAGSLIGIYAARSGKSESEVKAILDEETWFTAAEAKAAGFADEVEEEMKVAASLSPERLQNFKAAPEGLKALFATPTNGRQPTPDEQSERQRESRIAAMCAEFGDLSLASSFIEAALSIADVEEILAEKTEERAAREDEIARLRGDPTREEKRRLRQAELADSWARVIAKTTPKHLRPFLKGELADESR